MNKLEKRNLLEIKKLLVVGFNSVFTPKQESETDQQVIDRQNQGKNLLSESEKWLHDLIDN